MDKTVDMAAIVDESQRKEKMKQQNVKLSKY